MLKTRGAYLVEDNKKTKKLDVKTYASICACDEITTISSRPFRIWASLRSVNLARFCSE
jgi:hypothetical protein